MKKINIYNKETNSRPSVLHANGMSKSRQKCANLARARGEKDLELYDVWGKILQMYENFIPEKKPLREDLTIVTWKGGKYRNVDTILEKSCRKFGVDLLILDWPDHIPAFWEASKAKVYNTLNDINTGKIKTKYMMAMDASDVLFLKHPNEIFEDYLDRFRGKKSAWCTEANDWPRFDLKKYVHNDILDEYLIKVSNRDKERAKIHGSRFSFINVGCVIGETKELKEFYETSYNIFKDIETNDQAMGRIAQYILGDENHIGDYNCEIFQCLYDVNLDTLILE